MKKFFVVIFVILSTLLLNACGSPVRDHDEMEVVSEEGILSSQTLDDQYLGTHLLKTEDGEILPLRSLSINLSDPNYLNNMVELLGFIDVDDAVFQVTGVKVLEVLSETSEEGEFVGYKNTEFGFEWKYYNNWEVTTSLTSVNFISPDGDHVTVSQEQFDYQPTVSDEGISDTPLVAYFSASSEEDLDLRKVGVDQMDAVRVESEGGVLDYYIYRSGYIYDFAFVPGGENVKDAENVFYEMLLEFRFTGFSVPVVEEDDSGNSGETEPVPELDHEMTTFESLPYSFSASYPSKWYYAGVSGHNGVLHHYGFSDESLTDDNEILSLDVISASAIPSGRSVVIGGRDLIMIEDGEGLSIYLVVADQGYKLSGPVDYKDLLIKIGLDIHPIETE